MRVRTRAQRRRGLTLVELVTTLAIASILFLGMGNAVYVASKALPSKNDPVAASVVSAQVLDQIACELETAVTVTNITSKSVSFTVADRDADGNPERIAYAWTGTVGDPLTRTYNGKTWNVVDSVTTFNLVANVRSVTEDYTNPGTDDVVASTLADLSTLLNTNSVKFGNSSTSNFGQYFLPTLASDIIAWRPTGVQVTACQDRIPGTFKVQMREGSSTMIPRSGILEERTINSSTLSAVVMTPVTYAFTTVPRQAPGNPLCFTLMWASGTGPGKFQTSRANTGKLATSSSTTDWSVSSTDSLQSVLYGIPMRAGTRRTATTQYLLNVGMSLGAGNGPTMQTTALTINHPEILASLWETKFAVNPTTVDANGDGTSDWVASPGPFNTAQVSSGTWTCSTDTLSTQPANDFPGVTIVDLRMQPMATGATAGFTIYTAWATDYCLSLQAALKLETDGTHTLTLSQKINSTTWATMISYTQLRAQAMDLHLIIDPVSLGVTVGINGVQKGTFPVTSLSLPSAPHAASIFASGGNAAFSYVRVRTLRAFP